MDFLFAADPGLWEGAKDLLWTRQAAAGAAAVLALGVAARSKTIQQAESPFLVLIRNILSLFFQVPAPGPDTPDTPNLPTPAPIPDRPFLNLLFEILPLIFQVISVIPKGTPASDALIAKATVLADVACDECMSCTEHCHEKD